MKIGVFDSGIGGLTVLKKLIEKYPNNEYVYYGDIKNVPYGDKNIEELKVLASNIIEFLISKKVDMIVIACGTISSNLYQYLKNKYNIKIVDIISPTIEFINNSKYENIVALGTKRTIDSKIFQRRLNKKVKEIACPMFVPLIESNKLDRLESYFNEYFKDIKNPDLIVLGCTHYPIIIDRLSNYFNNSVIILNMADYITNIENSGIPKVDLYFSKLDDTIIYNIDLILKETYDSINLKEDISK